MRKIIYVLLLLALLTSFVANTKAQHIEFRGLYLGMDRDAVDSLVQHSAWDYEDPEWTSEQDFTQLVSTANKEPDIFTVATIIFNDDGLVERFSLSPKIEFKKQEDSNQWYTAALASMKDLYGEPIFKEEFEATYRKIKNKKFDSGHNFDAWVFPSPYAYVDMDGVTTNIQVSIRMSVNDRKFYWSISFADRSLSDIGR